MHHIPHTHARQPSWAHTLTPALEKLWSVAPRPFHGPKVKTLQNDCRCYWPSSSLAALRGLFQRHGGITATGRLAHGECACVLTLLKMARFNL